MAENDEHVKQNKTLIWQERPMVLIMYLIATDGESEGSVLWQVSGVHRVDVGHEQKWKPDHYHQKGHQQAPKGPFTQGPVFLTTCLEPRLKTQESTL